MKRLPRPTREFLDHRMVVARGPHGPPQHLLAFSFFLAFSILSYVLYSNLMCTCDTKVLFSPTSNRLCTAQNIGCERASQPDPTRPLDVILKT